MKYIDCVTKNYRYEICPVDLGEYRNSTLGDKFEQLDPDGFTCAAETGDAILESNGWTAVKSLAEDAGE